MANIKLDLANYQNDDGTFDTDILHELTHGLDVTFDVIGEIPETLDGILTCVMIEFAGSYEDLIALIDRYEEDSALRPELITEITNIHN